jgi:hypothetical protein
MPIQTTQQTPPAIAAVFTPDGESYDTWKRAFDQHAPARQRAGVVATHINRHADVEGRLSVYIAGNDPAKLDGLLKSSDLMETMHDAGVKGPPHVAVVTPVEDLTVKDRALAGLILRHEVRDFAAWKRGFDAHAAARAAGGIVGHAVNRSAQNPNVVVIYLQAESLDPLRAFASNKDLKSAMEAAGVIGAPEFTFVRGSAWES